MVLNGKEVVLIYDGDREVLIEVNDEHDQLNIEERMWDYINKIYWYLPKLDRRKVALTHGISMVNVVNNFVFFETMVPNRNYYKHIQKCRERFGTSITINNPTGFMFLSEEDIEGKLSE